MAEPTAVNSQVTDAVTQANLKVLGEAPAMAMGNVYQAMAHSLGLMFENAVNAQQQQNMVAQAATTQGIVLLYQATGTVPPLHQAVAQPDSPPPPPSPGKAG